ncbi:hypothetical protein Trydic_g34 [Trypoxylus dichotomus]
MTYASVLWATAATTRMRELQTFQNRILRTVLSAPWFVKNATLHEDAGMESLMDFIRRIGTIISGSPGSTLDHGRSSWTTRSRASSLLLHHPEMEPSYFVEDAIHSSGRSRDNISISSKTQFTQTEGGSGSWNPE